MTSSKLHFCCDVYNRQSVVFPLLSSSLCLHDGNVTTNASSIYS